MATPTRAQAGSFLERQRVIAVAAALAIRRLLERRAPLPQVARVFAQYQIAAALAATRTVAAWADAPTLSNPGVFGGVSSEGFPVLEPLVSTIDRFDPAPAEAVPDPWWDDAQAFMAAVQQLILTEIADASRTASQVEMIGQGWTEYVRMLNPPSCDRCTILAGRVYRDLEAFKRHSNCDCQMIPIDDMEAAKARGLLADPQEAFDRGLVTGLSKADAQAIRDGADMTTIVNAKRAGLRAPAGVTNAYTTDLFGHRVKATLYGTTRRSAWRKANPTRLVRLRPESIYRYATSREDALRLLRLYGYIR